MVVAQYWPLGFKLWRLVLTTTNIFIKTKVNNIKMGQLSPISLKGRRFVFLKDITLYLV